MNMMTTLNLRAMVSNENGEAKTTSYAVAEAFKKRHSDVLRAIKNMKCSQKFRERNFALCFENNQFPKKWELKNSLSDFEVLTKIRSNLSTSLNCL